MNPKKKTVLTAAGILAAVWVLALGGFLYARSLKVTPEKVRDSLAGLKLEGRDAGDREKALGRFADQLNQLGADERREVRADEEWRRLFQEMTDAEKLGFIEKTLPTGVKQALEAFEKLDGSKRQQAVADAVKRMREGQPNRGQGGPPPLSDEARERIIQSGLGAYFRESSAQTKAELAPVLEEIQRAMESGRLLRNRGR